MMKCKGTHTDMARTNQTWRSIGRGGAALIANHTRLPSVSTENHNSHFVFSPVKRGSHCFPHLCPLFPPPAGESVSVIKHTDPVPDPRAVNQDKKNMLFSVSDPQDRLSFCVYFVLM